MMFRSSCNIKCFTRATNTFSLAGRRNKMNKNNQFLRVLNKKDITDRPTETS